MDIWMCRMHSFDYDKSRFLIVRTYVYMRFILIKFEICAYVRILMGGYLVEGVGVYSMVMCLWWQLIRV